MWAAGSRIAPMRSWRKSTSPSTSIVTSMPRTSPRPRRTLRCSPRKHITVTMRKKSPRSRHDFVRDRQGSFDFKRALEDIHMNVESRLGELIGPAAGRLHTRVRATIRFATDFRLYVRDTIDETDAALASFQHALVERALEHAGTVMPGSRLLQPREPDGSARHLDWPCQMMRRRRPAARSADA